MVALEGGAFSGGDYMVEFFDAALPWVAMGLVVAFVCAFSDVILSKRKMKSRKDS